MATKKELEDRISKLEKKKWFSLGWLIFWVIVFWPAAIIYMVMKSSDRSHK